MTINVVLIQDSLTDKFYIGEGTNLGSSEYAKIYPSEMADSIAEYYKNEHKFYLNAINRGADIRAGSPKRAEERRNLKDMGIKKVFGKIVFDKLRD
jgi:hypothetical protein